MSEGADEPYWSALRAGRLELPQCSGCGRWRWPAVWRCGDCGSWDHKWRAVPMAGAIYSWTRTWHAFAGAEELGRPFVSVVVQLSAAGGIRLLGLLEGDEGEIDIGDTVQGVSGETRFHGLGIPMIRWRRSS